MSVVLLVCAALLAVASLLLVVRLALGPTMLDRAVVVDVLVAVTICAVGLHALASRSTAALPVALVATMLGFVGSVSLARFATTAQDVEEEEG